MTGPALLPHAAGYFYSPPKPDCPEAGLDYEKLECWATTPDETYARKWYHASDGKPLAPYPHPGNATHAFSRWGQSQLLAQAGRRAARLWMHIAGPAAHAAADRNVAWLPCRPGGLPASLAPPGGPPACSAWPGPAGGIKSGDTWLAEPTGANNCSVCAMELKFSSFRRVAPTDLHCGSWPPAA